MMRLLFIIIMSLSLFGCQPGKIDKMINADASDSCDQLHCNIVIGPILYKGKHETVGPNKVTVPEAFFKVVLCMNGTPKAIGFIYKNHSCNNPKSSYVNSIDQVERITGFDFFPNLPDDIEEMVESKANLSEW